MEKFLFFSFCWEHAFNPIFTVCTILSTSSFNWAWYGSVLYGLHAIFSNHKLRSLSQNSDALMDTRVFAMPFRENMTLRIYFITELFLFNTNYFGPAWKRVYWESHSSNVCMIHGSTSLGHECKEVCVKFLNSLHFLHLFIYSLRSQEYPGHCASNFILFCVATTPQCIL